jgi:hypothetical protein
VFLATDPVSTFTSGAALVMLVAIAWIVYRGGGGTALDVLQKANKVLEEKVHDLEAQVTSNAKTIAELQARTDVAEALEPLMAWAHTHEHNAETRSARQLTVLELIANRLGPDGD